jgi:hypothetical protein
LGALVEAERQTHSREWVGAAMCVAPAIAEPRAGVESLERVAVAAAVGASAAAAVGVVAASVAAAAVGVVAAAAAAVAAGGDAGRVFISPFSLAKEALRRKCRCVEAPEILLTSHWSGAGA